ALLQIARRRIAFAVGAAGEADGATVGILIPILIYFCVDERSNREDNQSQEAQRNDIREPLQKLEYGKKQPVEHDGPPSPRPEYAAVRSIVSGDPVSVIAGYSNLDEMDRFIATDRAVFPNVFADG